MNLLSPIKAWQNEQRTQRRGDPAADALAYVRQRVDPRMTEGHRMAMEREWMKSLAFLSGNQHFIEVGGGFKMPRLPPHRVLYRANMIRTMVTRAVTTVLANTGTFRAPAKDWSKVARDRAFVSEKLFEHLREVTHFEDALEDAVLWAAVCGSGFMSLEWDQNQGAPDRFYLDETGADVAGLGEEEKVMAENEGRFRDIPRGEVAVGVPHPFHMHWDHSARRDFYQAKWAATQTLVDIPTLEDTYGKRKVAHVKPLEPNAHSLWYDEMISFMAGMGLGSGPATLIPADKRGARTTLTRYWEVPQTNNKWRGRYIVVAGDVVLVNGENPYAATKFPLPFVKIDWHRRPGSFIGHSLVEDLRNPQFQYNKARATQTEAQNVYSHPAIIVDKRSGLPTGHMSIEPGSVHEADLVATAGHPLILGPVPNLPKELSENATRAMGEMQTIASQSDPDMSSKLPGQIRGAPGLQLMAEEKNKALLPAARSSLRATLLAGRMMLSLAKNNYTGERVVRYVGPDNAYRVRVFQASDLQDDLRIVGEPVYFKTKATDKAQIVEYVQTGILDPINNPEDKLMVLKVLAFGNAEEVLAERLADEENQEREWDELVADPQQFFRQSDPTGSGDPGQGFIMQPIQPYDDDDAHIRVMTRRMKSEEFRQLDPVAQHGLSVHLQQHQERQTKKQLQMMKMMEMQRGGPGQRGQASRPKKAAGAKQPQ